MIKILGYQGNMGDKQDFDASVFFLHIYVAPVQTILAS